MKKAFNTIKTQLLNDINDGKIRQKSPWEFRLRSCFSWLVFLLLVIFVVYLCSFIMLIANEFSIIELLGFGPRGVMMFFMTIPWLVMVIVFALVIVMYMLLHKFKFVYKRPIINSLLIIVFGSLFISSLVLTLDPRNHFGRVGYNDRLLGGARVHDYYLNEEYRHVWKGVLRIYNINDWYIEDARGRINALLIDDASDIDEQFMGLDGEEIVVFGEKMKDSKIIKVNKLQVIIR